MEGVRVVRQATPAVAGPAWQPLQMTWAVAAGSVGSRHVCGGWFSLPAGATKAWPQAFAVESAWYVTAGTLEMAWIGTGATRSARVACGTFVHVPAGCAITFSGGEGGAGLVLFGGANVPSSVEVGVVAVAGEPWIAQVETLPSDTDYEPPLDMRWGVTDRLGGARLLCGARTLDPPRGRIQHHYHDGVEAIIFFLDGAFRMFSGPDREPIDVRPGDIVYIPPGTFHSYCSMEESAMAEEVAFYGGVANKADARTVFVEAPWVQPVGNA